MPLVQKQKGGAGGVAQIWLVFSDKVAAVPRRIYLVPTCGLETLVNLPVSGICTQLVYPKDSETWPEFSVGGDFRFSKKKKRMCEHACVILISRPQPIRRHEITPVATIPFRQGGEAGGKLKDQET